MRKILEDVRKLTVTGGKTYYVTIPREFIKELKWRKGQRLVIRKEGEKVVLEDFKE